MPLLCRNPGRLLGRIASLLHGALQRTDINSGERSDGGLLGSQVHLGGRDGRNLEEDLLDPADAGCTGHPLHRQFDAGGESPALVPNVVPGDVVILPEGTYNIISNYGDANSVVRSDIRVQAGKLTDTTITHRAAVITLKLVSEKGGEALANTAWSVITPGGDVVKESIGAFPRVILAEGEYRAIAKNEGKVFERTFSVVNGVDGEVEVVAR